MNVRLKFILITMIEDIMNSKKIISEIGGCMTKTEGIHSI